MQKDFIKNIEEKNLTNKNEKILIAVSGGADSVVLLDLFVKSKFDVAIAHCNFKLRKNDSNLDENFVKNLSEKYNIPFFIKICDAKAFSEKNKISIEMAARKLRYDWFEQIAKKNFFDKIATAHHSGDSVETILMNLSRKTGIRGLIGIPEKNNRIIRPLLFASKSQIIEYCDKNKLEFRTDKTNFETIFQRNKIRHLIIPEFEKINPAFSLNVIQSAENLRLYKDFFDIHFKKFKNKCVIIQNNIVKIEIEKFKSFEPKKLFLYEFLRNYNFNDSQVEMIIDMLDNQSGKMFYTDEYRLVKERNYLIINKKNKQENSEYFIKKNSEKISINVDLADELKLQCSFIEVENLKLTNNRNFAFFDADKLDFPLKIRKWQAGDFFRPYGMKGRKKKLSNFFKDNKLTQVEKENIWIIESNGKIIWIVGFRTDDNFKITKQTTKIYILKRY